MENKRGVSSLTRNNWIMDAGLFLTAVVTVLSGIYFLFLPDGGFMGGRNPWYGVRILFLRETWEWLHTWIGVGMVVIALVHIIFHWKWVKSMFGRVFNGKAGAMSARGKYNLGLNTATALSFLISALSGLYFLFAGGSHGGTNPDPMFIFSRTAWDMIHTWSSVVFIITAILHFIIHWGWIVKVTKKVFQFNPEGSVQTKKQQPRLGEKEYTMIKKGLGITLLVVVIGVLAFGAINRTQAKSEETVVSAESELLGNGYGNGNGKGNEVTPGSEALAPIEEHSEDGYGYGAGEPLIETLPLGELNQAETDALLFMYEEEKLARDVYTSLGALYTQPMFSNIASSEQTHMDSVKGLLDRYGLAVPVADTADVFNNADLQKLYNDLTAQGSQSLAEALKVGAAIEEIDILDLKESLEETDQEDIRQVFESLLAGSYNHLNAFSSVYAQQAGTAYEPQFMTDAEWAEYQAFLAENGLFSGSGGRGRGNGGQGGGGRK